MPSNINMAQDYLSTTPQKMLKTLEAVLSAYDTQKGKHTMIGQTSQLMNPEVIQKMRKLEAFIKKEYL